MSQTSKVPTHDFPSETKSVLDAMNDALRILSLPRFGETEYDVEMRLDRADQVAKQIKEFEREDKHEARLIRESWDRTTPQMGAEPPED